MAANLQLLKRRIKTAQNIAQIAKAMEMISASKIKRAQTAVENNKPYRQRITDLTAKLTGQVDTVKYKHKYLTMNDSQKTLLIVISPDKGLCGSLNTNIFKSLLEIDNKNLRIVTVGKKVHQFCQRLEGEVIASFNMGTTLPDYQVVFDLIEIINQEFTSGNVSSVKIIYSQFNAIFSQVPTTRTLLPIEVTKSEDELPYVFEPVVEEIVDDLLPYYVEVVLYGSLIEAFTSEQAARMVAMQNAKINALDIADYLTLSYNKSRQERITSELLSLNSV